MRDRNKYRRKRQKRYLGGGSRILNRHRNLEISVEPEEDLMGSKIGISIAKGGLWSRFGPKGRFLAVAFLIGMGITITKVYYDRTQIETFYSVDKENMPQIELGRSLYQTNCAFCHGDQLEGKRGWNKKYAKGKRPAPPLGSMAKVSQLSNRELFDIVKFGGQPFSPLGYANDMPGFEMILSDSDIWSILAFIRVYDQKY